MPDLWDTNPHNAFSAPDKQPTRPQRQQRPHQGGAAQDHRGRLRPPAYVLIALVIALVAIVLLLAGVLFAPD